MRWLMEFYNERRGILARYAIEAPLPAAAVALGRKAVVAEYPSPPRRRRLSLFERAERVGGQDASGWVLYRIVKDNGQGSTRVVSAPATSVRGEDGTQTAGVLDRPAGDRPHRDVLGSRGRVPNTAHGQLLKARPVAPAP
jgi:hypothetical protein